MDHNERTTKPRDITASILKAWNAKWQAFQGYKVDRASFTEQEWAESTILAGRISPHEVVKALNDHCRLKGQEGPVYNYDGLDGRWWGCVVVIPEYEGLFPAGELPRFATKKESQKFAANEAIWWLKANGLFVDEDTVMNVAAEDQEMGGVGEEGGGEKGKDEAEDIEMGGIDEDGGVDRASGATWEADLPIR